MSVGDVEAAVLLFLLVFLPWLLKYGRDQDGNLTLRSCKQAVLAVPRASVELAAIAGTLLLWAMAIAIPFAILLAFVQLIKWMWNFSL